MFHHFEISPSDRNLILKMVLTLDGVPSSPLKNIPARQGTRPVVHTAPLPASNVFSVKVFQLWSHPPLPNAVKEPGGNEELQDYLTPDFRNSSQNHLAVVPGPCTRLAPSLG